MNTRIAKRPSGIVIALCGILCLLAVLAFAPMTAYADSTDPHHTANRDNGGLAVSDGKRFYFYSHKLESILSAKVSDGASSVRTVLNLAHDSKSRGISCMALDDDYLYFAYAYKSGSKEVQQLCRISATEDGGESSKKSMITTEELAKKMHKGDARNIAIQSITLRGSHIYLGVVVTESDRNQTFRYAKLSTGGEFEDDGYVSIDGRDQIACCDEFCTWSYSIDGSKGIERAHIFASGSDKYKRIYTAPEGSNIEHLQYADNTLYYYETDGTETGKYLMSMSCYGGKKTEVYHMGALEELVSFVPTNDYVMVSASKRGEDALFYRIDDDGKAQAMSLDERLAKGKTYNLYDLGHGRVLAMSTYDDPDGRAGDLVFMLDVESGKTTVYLNE